MGLESSFVGHPSLLTPMKNTSSVVYRLAALMGGLLVLSGCASSYRFHVDAVNNQAVEMGTGSYRISCASPEMDEHDIRFLEAVSYVKTALSSKGMYEAPSGIEPDMTVEVDFGIEGPIEVIEYRTLPAMPVMTTDDSRNTRSMTMGRDVPASPAHITEIENVQVPVIVTYYDKFLRITAREDQHVVEGDAAPRTAWSLVVGNRDSNSDLREYLPLLVSAGMDAIGSESEQNQRVVLTAQDERVLFVKNGL
jgi:hypothetical protein